MKPLEGRLFDGKSTAVQRASLGILGQSFELFMVAEARRYGRSEVVIRERIGNNPRVFEFPDGLRFETDDNDTVDKYFASRSGLAIVHALEHNWRSVALALSAFLAFVALFYFVLLPRLARNIAFSADRSTLVWLSNKTWDVMEDQFTKSEAPEDDVSRITSQLKILDSTFPAYRLKLELYRGEGPLKLNAFALPDGRIIFTDEMVSLLTEPDEVMAVMLHELGHVVYRHGVQNLVQTLAVSGFFMVMAGGADWSAIAGVLVSSSYSRDHEREADYFAANEMIKLKRNPAALGEALDRMRQREKALDGIPGFLSSHPVTDERIKYLRAYKRSK